MITTAFLEGLSALMVIPMLEGLGQNTTTVTNDNVLLRQIDIFFQDVPPDQLLQAAALVFMVLTVLKTLIALINVSFQSWLQYRLDRELRSDVYHQLVMLSYENLNQRQDSEWQMLLNSETGRAASAIFSVLLFLSSLLSVMVYIGALVIVSWQMTLVATILMIVVLGLLTGIVRYVDRLGKLRYTDALAVTHGTMETLSAKRIIRIMHQQDYESKKYNSMLADLQQSFLRLTVASAASRQLLELLVIGLLACLLILSGFVLGVEQVELVPMVSAFILILYRMMPHVLVLNAQRTKISAELTPVRNIVKVLETDSDQFIKDGTQGFEGLKDRITFQDVSFNYHKRDIQALKHLSFDIKRGETVALVGSSGAGKSTTIDLLLRLYDPQQGKILIDGHNLQDLRLKEWLAHIGTVSQETFIFNNTVAYNISYGTPNPTQAQIEEAARLANAHDFIMEMPEQYETMVGERGVLLSGGQRQRIAIARAILRDPEILILDEATSALDSENEKLIQTALHRLSHDRTVVVIAHRFSTILNSDKIVVMENGAVIEMGKHDELLAKDGRYAYLYRTQFAPLERPTL